MKKIVDKYLIEKTDRTHIQCFRYIFVGGIATVVDISIFYVFNNIFTFHYLLAQTAGFIFSLIVNYSISIFWIFKSTGNIKKEFTVFTLVGIGGLLWSYLILWILIDRLQIGYFQNMLAKSVAVVLALIWNFVMRKRFVFKTDK